MTAVVAANGRGAAAVRPAVPSARAASRHTSFHQSRLPQLHTQKATRRVSTPAVQEVLGPVAALELDWSDPDTLIGAAGAMLGLALGIGIPVFFISRDEKDEERLEELRELNRQTYKETGEYLSPDEIEAIRPPRWTDRREFVDDD